jgi:hypothetical protein
MSSSGRNTTPTGSNARRIGASFPFPLAPAQVG